MTEAKPKALVIDDEELLRLGVKRLLELEDYDVDVASGGVEGVEKATSGDFDVALIDLKMPDLDGVEVLRRIREKRPHTVCYIATAYASYETAVEATRLGAQGYILKPFTDDELLDQLEKGVRKRRLELESARLRQEREERMLELATERSRLKTVVNALADGVLVVNYEGKAVYYNPAALTYLGLDDLSLEEPALDKLPEELRRLISQYLDEPEKRTTAVSKQLALKPNYELTIEATCTPAPNPDGSIAGVVVALKNITELKRIEHLKNQFVSMVSHELKAPVAASIGFLNTILDPDTNLDEETQTRFMERAVSRLNSLLTMVNDLLDISRMELKTAVRELKEVNLAEILEETISLFKMDIEKKQIGVDFETEENLPTITADENEVQRLFTNLISNAVKYNRQGGTLVVRAKRAGAYAATTVRDTGVGLKPEEKKKLFSEFFRAKNEFTKGIHGTGLGMSIVKRIVDSYSGKIEFESEYGAGTTFVVSLPIRREEREE
ncbi:MAG: response regulator [Ignavibacteriales bacterium]|nr:response regulator [Ignavibacteriales bacterium]